MADTIRGDFPDEKCDDCGQGDVIFHHWGPLTNGVFKKLCGGCMGKRDRASRGVPNRFDLATGIPDEPNKQL